MTESDTPDGLDKADEEKQREGQTRLAQRRLELSQSVEETLADTSLQEDEWLDDEDELDSQGSDAVTAGQAPVKDTTLIPPRLSLQSKPMPVVRPDSSEQSAELLLHPVDAINRVPTQPSAIDSPANVSLSQATLPPTDAIHHVPTPQSVSTPRLAGRTTKVLLKAITRSEEGVQTGEAGKSSSADTPDIHAVTAGQGEGNSETEIRQVIGAALFGSGIFKRGQGDVVIDNPVVTRTSVIVVMLTSDPGHVVVQYVSLQPQAGFTVHLSAPAEREAGFHYVILMEE